MTNAVKSAANSAIKRAANRTPAKREQGLKGIVKQMESRIKGALTGTALSPERFTNVVLTALSENPKLMQCSPESFCAAMMQSAQLGIEPNTVQGLAYLIPYGKQCQFILSYKGMIELAKRSGEIANIQAHAVHENDEFHYELGLHPDIKHIPVLFNRGDVIGYYASYTTKDGYPSFTFMSIEDIEKHGRKFSKTFNNGPWKTDFDSMAKKTVIKQLLKYAPMSVEYVRGAAADETVKSLPLDRDMDMDIVNLPEEEIEYEIEPETGEVIDDLAPDPDDPFPEGQQKFA